MRCFVQELISDLSQESYLPRHIHLIRQHIIPEVLACFLRCSSTCINTLIFDCLFRLRYDWPWENPERIPLVYTCFWWLPWKHARISWQFNSTQCAENSKCCWCIREKLYGHWIRQRGRFGGCLNLWSIQSPRIRITGKPSQSIYISSCNEEDYQKSMSHPWFFPSSFFEFQRHRKGAAQA